MLNAKHMDIWYLTRKLTTESFNINDFQLKKSIVPLKEFIFLTYPISFLTYKTLPIEDLAAHNM